MPVVIENHVCGSLVLLNRQGEPAFTPRDERLMELFGDTLSLALQNLLDERRAREVARRDSLTSLYNDRYFHRKLQREIDRLAEIKDGELALLFLDCDHLKKVNDVHGHLAGSQVLREVSFILQRTLADTVSLACRYGGDEFTVILLDATREAAVEIAEKIRKAIDDWTFLPMSIGPGEPALNLKNVITMSIGVATYRTHVNAVAAAARAEERAPEARGLRALRRRRPRARTASSARRRGAGRGLARGHPEDLISTRQAPFISTPYGRLGAKRVIMPPWPRRAPPVTSHLDPKSVLDSLSRHMLVDGYHVVMDLKRSRGNFIYDALHERRDPGLLLALRDVPDRLRTTRS